MKCPRCLAVCLDDDPRCPSCRTPLGGDLGVPPVADRRRRATRLALVCLAVGVGLGPIVGAGIALVPPSPGAPYVNIFLWAGLGAVIGLASGYALGLALPRPK